MKSIDKDQIDRLLEDISSIKTVINRNRPILQQVFHPARFRWFMLVTALSVIGFSLLIFFLMQHYGSFGATPGALRYLIYAAIAAESVFLQIWKMRRFSFSLRKVDRALTLGWFFKEFYASRIAHLYVPLVALILFLSIYFAMNNIPYFIVPTISIGYGLLCNFVGTMTQIRHTLLAGYWFLGTGICAILFSFIPGPVALAMTVGCGLLIISISGFLSREAD